MTRRSFFAALSALVVLRPVPKTVTIGSVDFMAKAISGAIRSLNEYMAGKRNV